MEIGSTGLFNNVLPSSSTTTATSAQAVTGERDGNQGAHHAHHGHRAGGMHDALAQALQSLGLSVPAQDGTASSSTSSSGNADADGDHDGSATSDGVKADMHQFMHALFDAVRSEKSSSADAQGASDGRGQSSSKLSALITDVSNGSAPADLQSSFDKLVADLQSAGASTQASSSDAGGNASAVSLQSLLEKMQQNLGYGTSSATAAVGNTVTACA